ncbi:MAG: 50S ribosomal protein L1 [Planctomycetes bacterium]|nr:50S ribosomal protein L1 [Planctomycetota bacterium]NBY03085.1 50S ribosomal protein L1 [Planctomycetota bacterium]
MAKSEKESIVSENAATPVAEPKTAPATTSSESSGKRKGKQPGRPPHKGKKLKAQIASIYAKVAKEGQVSLDKAITILKQVKRAKFDESIEIHMSLGIDSAQSDQMIRGSVALPHGVGKKVRVLVFCQADNATKAKAAGADFVGDAELIKKIQSENWLEFDVVLATQDMMGQVSRLGKVLGPRGLMPTPKAGTVISSGQDIGSIVKEFKSGKVEYRSDKGGNVHAGIGKISFDADKIASNAIAFVEQVRASKPAGIRGNYIKSVTISATMCPGIPVTI